MSFFSRFSFSGVNRLVFQYVQDEQAGGVIEEAGDEMPERSLASLTRIHCGPIHERTGDFLVGDVTLRFQNSEDGLHRAVSHRTSFLQGSDDVAYGRGLALPEHRHHPGFGVCECSEFAFPWHGNLPSS